MSGISNVNSYERKLIWSIYYKDVRMPLSGAQRRSNREIWRPEEQTEPREASTKEKDWKYIDITVS